MIARFAALFQVLVLFALSNVRAAESTNEIRVMSFNVRTSRALDGQNGWSHRKDLFFQTIQAFNPELIGFEEVRDDQHDDIAAQMKEYGLSGC